MQKVTPLPVLIGAATLCELSGMTDQRHRQLAIEKKFPPPKNGYYVLKETIQGLFKYYSGKGDGVSEAQKLATLRKTEAEADKTEMENAEKRKEMISTKQLRKVQESIFYSMATRIQTSTMSEKEKAEMMGFFEHALNVIPKEQV